MPPTAQRQRTLNPPLIVALIALLALAAVTVWVVLRGDDTVDAGESGTGAGASGNGSGSSSSQPSEDPDPEGTAMDASNGAFSTLAPDGWEDGAGVVNEIDGSVLTLYDTATESESMPSHIIIAAEDDDGTKLDDAISQIQEGFEDQYDASTEDSDIDLTEIDGETAKGWQTSDYKDGSTDVNSTQFAVIHDGKYYFFTVNSLPEYTDSARAALEAIMTNTTWT